VSGPRSARAPHERTRGALRVLAVVVVVAVGALIVVFRSSPRKTLAIGVLTTRAYGSVLVVQDGPLAGFPLYEFSGDVGGKIGCGTTKARGYDLDPNGALEMTCSGPMDDIVNTVTSDDWPALTSKSLPRAGRGVKAHLLGSIFRKGIGHQITYGGHPLYLFDPSSAPFKPLGEDYLETIAPLAPWHGYWSLVSAKNGGADEGVATIERGTLSSGAQVLAVEGDPNVNPVAVTVYTYSGRTCPSTCAPQWLPVLTTATPRLRGVSASDVGVVKRADGSLQVTFDKKPLYEYWKEKVALTPHGSLVATGTAGNGNGLFGPGGTFSVVSLAS
jgi:predicted lipoprotein with Yx(FWY)xxD motif